MSFVRKYNKYENTDNTKALSVNKLVYNIDTEFSLALKYVLVIVHKCCIVYTGGQT